MSRHLHDGQKSCHFSLKKWLISGNLAIWAVLVLEKASFYCFWVPREITLGFCSKNQWHTFLLISGRNVGAHVDGHQHGVSIQISINLGKTFLRISRLRKIAVIWIWVFAYLPSSIFQILDFVYWTAFIFILMWRDTENQQLIKYPYRVNDLLGCVSIKSYIYVTSYQFNYAPWHTFCFLY